MTHTHSDHIGNVDELLSTYPVDRVYLKKYSDSRITNSERLWDNLYGYDKVLQTAAEKVFQLFKISHKGCSFSVWGHGYSAL